MDTITIKGTVVQGHRVASAPSGDYPYGTIEKQKPYFKALGLDLENFYNGTLNILIYPNRFEMKNPEFTFERVEWTDLHPPETFSFSKCAVMVNGIRYSGWVYYPHPETKKRNFQQSSVIEIIAQYIPGSQYGDWVELELNNEEVQLEYA